MAWVDGNGGASPLGCGKGMEGRGRGCMQGASWSHKRSTNGLKTGVWVARSLPPSSPTPPAPSPSKYPVSGHKGWGLGKEGGQVVVQCSVCSRAIYIPTRGSAMPRHVQMPSHARFKHSTRRKSNTPTCLQTRCNSGRQMFRQQSRHHVRDE